MKKIIEHTKVRFKLLWVIIQAIVFILLSPLLILIINYDQLEELKNSLTSDLERLGKESEQKSLW